MKYSILFFLIIYNLFQFNMSAQSFYLVPHQKTEVYKTTSSNGYLRDVIGKIKKKRKVEAIDLNRTSIRIRYENVNGWVNYDKFDTIGLNDFFKHINKKKYTEIKDSKNIEDFENYLKVSFKSEYRNDVLDRICELQYQNIISKKHKPELVKYTSKYCSILSKGCQKKYCSEIQIALNEIRAIERIEEEKKAYLFASENPIIKNVLNFGYSYRNSKYIPLLLDKVDGYQYEQVQSEKFLSKTTLKDVLVAEKVFGTKGDGIYDFVFDLTKTRRSFGSKEYALLVGNKMFFSVGNSITFTWSKFNLNNKIWYINGDGIVQKNGIMMQAGASILIEK